MAAPVSINPAVVSKFGALDPRTRKPIDDPEFDGLVRAVAELQASATSIDDMAGAVAGDKTHTSEANAARLRASATPIASAAAGRLDAALERAAAETARLMATMNPPAPRDAVAAGVHAELRQVLRDLSDAKRREAIAGDEAAAVAALSAPPMLSGMSPSHHGLLLGSWQKNKFPAEVSRLERLAKAIEASERTGATFVRFVDEKTNNPAARNAEAAATRAASAIVAASLPTE